MESTLFIGDLHLGDPLMVERKLAALRSLVTHGTRLNVRLVLLGDVLEFGETANRAMMREETRKIVDDFRSYQTKTGKTIEVISGNHDRYIGPEVCNELFPDVDFNFHGQFYTDKHGTIVAHHGDLADVQSKPVKHYLDQFQGSTMEDIVKFCDQEGSYMTDRQAYHKRNMISVWALMFILESCGLSVAAQQKWHDWYYSRSLFKNSCAALARGTVYDTDNYELAFNTWLLEKAQNAKLVVQAHTHVPVQMKWQSETGREGLVTNAGSLFSAAHLPTAALWTPDNSTQTMLQWRDGRWVEASRTRLGQKPSIYMPRSVVNKQDRFFEAQPIKGKTLPRNTVSS